MHRCIFAKFSQRDTNSHDVYLEKNQGYCEIVIFCHFLNYAYRQNCLSFTMALYPDSQYVYNRFFWLMPKDLICKVLSRLIFFQTCTLQNGALRVYSSLSFVKVESTHIAPLCLLHVWNFQTGFKLNIQISNKFKWIFKT